ncbi:MAG: AraC family transcriptional regulator, partial [Roseburia sp.]|nr:AraC family transcriptional regulator [Roseburia sp.]
IAFAAGYNSVEYFLYIFKKKLRMTPSQYRDSHK